MRLVKVKASSGTFFVVGILAIVLFLNAVPQLNAAEGSVEQVRQSLDTLDEWLANSDYAGGWNKYLLTVELRAQLAKGDQAEAKTVADILQRYRSGAAGLDKSRFAAVRRGLEAWVAELAAVPAAELPAAELPQAALAAKSRFVPPTVRQLAASKSAVASNATRLNSFLARNPRWGRVWKEYLGWEELQRQLNSESPDSTELATVVQRLSDNHAGLEHPRFMELRGSLRKWMDDGLAANKSAAVQKKVDVYATELAEKLANYSADSGHWDAIDIGSRVRFFERFGVAPEVTAAVRRHHSHPNFSAYLSADLIAAGLDDKIDEPITIRETILGTYVVGSGHTVGKILVGLIPDDRRAVLDFRMTGTTQAVTTGYNRSVQIYTTSTTKLKAEKQIEFSPEGVSALPATATADTATSVNGLSTSARFGGRMIERIAWKKVGQSKGQAQREGSRKAAQRLRKRVDQQADKLIADADEKYQSKFRKPLLRKEAFPALFDVHTKQSAIQIEMMEASADQLAAPIPVTPPPTGSDMGIRLHESFVNNFAAIALGGTTFRSEDAAKSADESGLLKKLKDQRDEKLRQRRAAAGQPEPAVDPEAEEEAPWEMVFARRNPVTLEFRDGTIKFTIRGTKFVGLDEKEFKRSMSIWGVYKIDVDEHGGLRLTLVEQGVDPTSVEKGGKFVAADAPVRSKLRARLTKALEGENGEKKVVEIFPLELPHERWKNIGEMAYTHVESKDGWLTITWDRVVKREEKQAAVEDDPADVARRPGDEALRQR